MTCLIAILVFFIFALTCQPTTLYWRRLLGALLCQLIAINLPATTPEAFVWALQWPFALGLMGVAAIKDPQLTGLARALFALLWLLLALLGSWEAVAPLYRRARAEPLPSFSTQVYGPREPVQRRSPSAESDHWESLVSEEGGFSVLSPLPAPTLASYHEIQGQQVRVTTTRIKDIDGLAYIVMSTTYPSEFPLPEPEQQAVLALNHLRNEYTLDQLAKTEALVQGGYNALGFHAQNSRTQEQVVGLILPTESTLFQILVIAPQSEEAEQFAQRFLTSFKPLRSTDHQSGRSLPRSQ